MEGLTDKTVGTRAVEVERVLLDAIERATLSDNAEQARTFAEALRLVLQVEREVV